MGRLPAFGAVFDDDVRVNAAPNLELGSQAHEARPGGDNEITEYLVGDRFVKRSFLAEAPDVEFERLEFHAKLVGNVLEEQLREIRLARFRAQAGKLGHPNPNGIIPRRLRIGEGFEFLAGLTGHVGGRLCESVAKANYITTIPGWATRQCD